MATNTPTKPSRKLMTPETLAVADPRFAQDRITEANALMADSLRLGKITVKEQLAAKIDNAKEALETVRAVYTKQWEPIHKHLQREAQLTLANDGLLHTLLDAFYKLTRVDRTERLNLKEWVSEQRIWMRKGEYCTGLDRHAPGNHRKLATLMKGGFTFQVASPLVPHSHWNDIEYDPDLYVDADVDLGDLLPRFVKAGDAVDAAAATLAEFERQLADLPKTLKTIERQLLETRLSSSPDGQRAMQLVSNAITALQGGNTTKLLP